MNSTERQKLYQGMSDFVMHYEQKAKSLSPQTLNRLIISLVTILIFFVLVFADLRSNTNTKASLQP